MSNDKSFSFEERIRRLLSVLICGLLLMFIGAILIDASSVFFAHPFIIVLIDTFLAFFVGMIISFLRHK